MRQTLEDARASGELVEVHRERLVDDALLGRVLGASEVVVLLEVLNPPHGPDGVAAVRPNDITRIKRGGAELAALAANTTWGEDPFLSDDALLELSAAATILERRFGHVTIFTEGIDPRVCFVGNMTDVDDDHLVLHQYGSMKTLDRSRLLIRYDSVSRVDAGGTYERSLIAAFVRNTRAGSSSG